MQKSKILSSKPDNKLVGSITKKEPRSSFSGKFIWLLFGIWILVITTLGSCGQVQPSGGGISVAALQGSWKYTYDTGTATYTFTDSNYAYVSTVTQYNSSGTYTISGSTITFTAITGYDIGSRDASISGNILTLTNNGVATEFIKQ